MKTSDLIGADLDRAVAECVGWEDFNDDMVPYTTTDSSHMHVRYIPFSPSTNWEQGGPIIDRMIDEGYLLQKADFGLGVKCFRLLNGLCQFAYGPTPLIAAMRCLVSRKLGDEVELPEELK